jgi:hypothetical protein
MPAMQTNAGMNMQISKTVGIKVDPIALASLILGVLSFPVYILVFSPGSSFCSMNLLLEKIIGKIPDFIYPIFLSIFDPLIYSAIILGIISIAGIGRNKKDFYGKGYAIAGICLGGILFLAISVLSIALI